MFCRLDHFFCFWILLFYNPLLIQASLSLFDFQFFPFQPYLSPPELASSIWGVSGFAQFVTKSLACIGLRRLPCFSLHVLRHFPPLDPNRMSTPVHHFHIGLCWKRVSLYLSTSIHHFHIGFHVLRWKRIFVRSPIHDAIHYRRVGIEGV